MEFIIYGKPEKKSRPRLGKGVVYNPDKKKELEVRQVIREIMKDNKYKIIEKSCVRCNIEFIFSVSKYFKGIPSECAHNIVGDLDNMCKFYLDCGNKLIYTDDRQITEMTCSKKYGKVARVIMRIEKI